jgi:integrase
VPPGLVEEAPNPGERCRSSSRRGSIPATPRPPRSTLLILLRDELGALRLPELTYTWAEAWVRSMKLQRNYAPGTIRKRIGALSRCLDAYLRKHPDVQLGNPLRLLPRGAATYNAKDAAEARKLGKEAKQDEVRERRLHPGEFERVIRALAGEKREDRERPLELKEADALRMLFLLVYYSGIRLREAYTITAGQLRMRDRALEVRSSKQWYGRVKMRTVPMRPQLHAAFTHYLSLREFAPDEPIFPWWNGTWDEKHLTTSPRSCRRSSRESSNTPDAWTSPSMTCATKPPASGTSCARRWPVALSGAGDPADHGLGAQQQDAGALRELSRRGPGPAHVRHGSEGSAGGTRPRTRGRPLRACLIAVRVLRFASCSARRRSASARAAAFRLSWNAARGNIQPRPYFTAASSPALILATTTSSLQSSMAMDLGHRVRRPIDRVVGAAHTLNPAASRFAADQGDESRAVNR